MNQHIVRIAGIVAIVGVFYLLVSTGEYQLLYSSVLPPDGTMIEDWLSEFQKWAIIVIVVSGLTSLFWYIMAQFAFHVDSWKESDKRGFWGVLILAPVIAVIVAVLFTQGPKTGGWLVYLLYGLNGLLCYYLSTVLFSPPSFKYTPWGATKLRRW